MTDGSWFHAEKSVVARSAGRSVVAAAAYRTGLSLEDEREMTMHDYTRKHGIAEVFVTTPEGMENTAWAHDIGRLSNAMEAHEKRKDSQVGHEWTISLPASLNAAQQSALSHHLAQALSDMYRVPVIGAQHQPGREGDIRNDHLHLLFPTREMTEEEGKLGAKITAITGLKSGPQEVKRYRECVADLINDALEDAGSDERVDARSYAERGIDREPTIKMGVSATALERRGVPTGRGDINRQIIEDRIAEQDADAQAIRDEMESRFGDGALSKPKAQFIRPSEAEYQKLVEEARSGTPVPADVAEYARMGREPMSRDMREVAQNPPAPPPGWMERMRNMAAHLADVWREEGADNDEGKAGLLQHVARVVKRVLKREEPEEEPPKEKEPQPASESFVDRVVQAGQDLVNNERGAGPGLDKFEAWLEAVREHLGESLLPEPYNHDPYHHDIDNLDEPEHDRGGPDIEW